jgi:hypothetical protein
MKRTFVRLYFIVFGLLNLFTIVYDNAHHLSDIVNQLSYFTMLCNIFITIVFLYLGFRPNTKSKTIRDTIRGAVIMYMILTGIVYNIFLAASVDALVVPWITFIYHKLMPIIAVVSWIIYPPLQKLSFKNAFVWLSFPLVYLIYTIIRGALTNWYPYYFIDATKRGYVAVVTFSLEILAATFLGSLILIALGNFLQKKR